MILNSLLGTGSEWSGLHLWSLWRSYCFYVQFKGSRVVSRGGTAAYNFHNYLFTDPNGPYPELFTHPNFEAVIFNPRYWGRMFCLKSGKTGNPHVYFAKSGRSKFSGQNSLLLEIQQFWHVRSCRLVMSSRRVEGKYNLRLLSHAI